VRCRAAPAGEPSDAVLKRDAKVCNRTGLRHRGGFPLPVSRLRFVDETPPGRLALKAITVVVRFDHEGVEIDHGVLSFVW
jgi:hypothetical protein